MIEYIGTLLKLQFERLAFLISLRRLSCWLSQIPLCKFCGTKFHLKKLNRPGAIDKVVLYHHTFLSFAWNNLASVFILPST